MVAFVGETVAVNCEVAGLLIDNVVDDKLTPVTATVDVTVTAQLATFAPSCVVAVIVALPAATELTKPVALTVATAPLLVVHVTVLLVAFVGETVAVNCEVAGVLIDNVVDDKLTLVTATVEGTVTVGALEASASALE